MFFAMIGGFQSILFIMSFTVCCLPMYKYLNMIDSSGKFPILHVNQIPHVIERHSKGGLGVTFISDF